MKVKRFTRIHLWIISITLLIVIFIGGWSATEYLGNIARQEIIKENEASFSILSTYILSELQKFESAVKSLARSPLISPALIFHGKQDIEHANSALDRYNSDFNSSVAYLMDTNGVTVASSNRNEPDSFVGKSYGFRSYFQAAMQGNQGRYYAVGITTGKRGFYTSFPVRNDNGEIIGVIALKKDIDEWEKHFGKYTNWFFIDPHGVIFLSSEKALLFASLWPINEKTKQELLTSRQFGDRPFEALMSQEVTDKMDIIFNGSHYITFRKVIDPEGWSIVLMSPTYRITVYKSVGVISAILIYTLIAIPLIVIYRTSRSAEMMQESEERFRRLADSTFEGILIHDKGEILDFNQSLAQMLGYEHDDVIGTNMLDMVAPESRGLVSLSMQGDTEKPIEVLICRKDGSIITMETHEKPIVYKGRQARVVALRDITEHKLAERALLESEEKFRKMSATAHNAMTMIDNDGNISFWNEAAEKIFGYSSQEVIGKNLHTLIVPQRYHEAHENGFREFKTTGNGAAIGKTLELTALRKNGEEFPVEISLSAMHLSGKWSAVGIIRDITRRKQYEEEIHTLSITDQLTGLYNRRGFIAIVEQQLKIMERTKEGAMLLFADLDGLKWINDNLGHNKGDEALVEAASIFKEIFRKSDIIARMGGDEFAVFALTTSQEYSVLLENRLHHLIASRNIAKNRDYKVSISIGVAYHDPANPSSIDELLTRADAIMYEHKKTKRMSNSSHTLK